MALRRVLLPAAVFIALLAPAAASAQSETRIAGSLANLAQGLGPDAGVLVQDTATGADLFSLRADRQLIPASNQKLFTTTAALLRYGPEATLPTTLQVRPGVLLDPATGILPGDVFLVGGGDPTLRDADLARLVTQLQRLGVRQIIGGVRADESFHDKRRGSFDSRWKIDSDLSGQLSALSLDHGRAGSAKEAAKRLEAQLHAAGITTTTPARTGIVGPGAFVAATISSPTIARLAQMTNVPSENFYAEMLVKDLGASFGTGGTTGKGLSVVRSALSSSIGIKPKMVDGSGLSRGNRTTARQLVNLLDKVAELPEIADAFAASLPRFGRDGTLRRRLRGTAASTRCAAKTGTLIGVSALSGYCHSPGGRRVAFAIVSNRVNSGGAKNVEDKLVKQIVGFTG